MSCLTRKLQQNLTKYLKRHNGSFASKDPADIRHDLVSKGICPSDVTTDQMRLMLKSVGVC